MTAEIIDTSSRVAAEAVIRKILTEADSRTGVAQRSLYLGGIVADGGVAEFTIEVKNHWDEAVNDLTVTDTLDGIGAFGGQYVPGSATATGGGTLAETAVTVAGDDVTVTWTIDRLEPGESTVITVPVPVPTDTADGTVIANTVAVASPDMPMDQRDGADITVRNPSPPPTPTKTMPATARPGDRFVVDVAVSTPPNAAFFDLTFADTLPDGLRFVGHRTPTCLQGTTSCDATFISPMGASVNGDGTTSIGWFFGDVNSSGLGRDYHLRYEVEVGDADREYLTWVAGLSRRLGIIASVLYGGVGIAWAVTEGADYDLTAPMAIALGGVGLAMAAFFAAHRDPVGIGRRALGAWFASLAVVAVIREVIRATALSRFNYDVGSYPYRVDWGSVAMFTVTTIVGVSIITYMVMVLFQSGIGAGERIPRGIDRLGRISTAMLGAWFAFFLLVGVYAVVAL